MKSEKVWPSVLSRRFGTVITKRPLTIGEEGYIKLNGKDLSLTPEKCYTLKEFQAKNC
jgi:hypothetical protein